MVEEKQQIRHIVRVAKTDLPGEKPLLQALTNVRGVSASLANALCSVAKLSKVKPAGLFSDDELHKIDEILADPVSNAIPSWMVNRRKDYETGSDLHLVSSDMTYQREKDIKRLRRVRAYKGFRHALGLPVRGQRTRSNFRRNKGKAMGVKRTKTER